MLVNKHKKILCNQRLNKKGKKQCQKHMYIKETI